MSQLPPCPKCSSEYTYEDGVQLVCPECGHEWTEAEQAAAEAGKVVRDANGNELHVILSGGPCPKAFEVQEPTGLFHDVSDHIQTCGWVLEPSLY